MSITSCWTPFARVVRRWRRSGVLAGSVAGLLLAYPAPAGAAKVAVQLSVDPDGGEPVAVARFVAAPGESNVLTVTAVLTSSEPGGVRWEFADAGAPVTPGSGCATIDAHTARCSSSAMTSESADVALGDSDDRITLTYRVDALLFYLPVVIADGGAGDDRLTGANGLVQTLRGGDGDDQLVGGTRRGGNVLDGGPGDDSIVGGNGGDLLDGGGGRDRIVAGGGDDHLTDGDRDGAAGDEGPGPDVLDGGVGRDELSYAHRTRPVFVDLADPGTDGEQGEGDQLSEVDSLTGGKADDRLAGDDSRNVLDGRGGRDRLIGRQGPDLLRPGGDSLSCGRGHDIVSPYGPYFLSVPLDTERHVGPRDLLPPDCELVGYSDGYSTLATMPSYPVSVSARSVVYPVRCPSSEDGVERCSGLISLREMAGRHRLLGSGRHTWRELTGHRSRAPAFRPQSKSQACTSIRQSRSPGASC